MQRVFADTGYWLALFNPEDDLHETAIQASQQIVGWQIVTSQAVFIEILDGFATRGTDKRLAAVQLIGQLENDANLLIIPLTSSWFDKAMGTYRRYRDKRWSLTDCMSFAIMSDLGIDTALAHDHHFEQAGFQALMRD